MSVGISIRNSIFVLNCNRQAVVGILHFFMMVYPNMRRDGLFTLPVKAATGCQVRPVPLISPLNELARSKPSDVMSRYSTSA